MALMIISVQSSIVQRLLSNKFFIFMGAISYPLYLLHDKAYSLYKCAIPDFVFVFVKEDSEHVIWKKILQKT